MSRENDSSCKKQKKEEDYIPTSQKIAHLEAVLLLLSAETKDTRYEEIIPQMLKDEEETGGVNMCKLLDKYENRGLETARGVTDGAYQEKLLAEFGLIHRLFIS